jgi:hypothetical protein
VGRVVTFDVDARSVAGAGDAIRALDPGPAMAGAVDAVGADAERAARARARRHRESGRLEAQLRAEVEGQGIAHTLTMRAGGPIAPIIIGGSVAHIIKPVHRRALASVSHAAGGLRHLAGIVHHPGTRPDPFVADAMDEAEAGAGRHLDEAGDRITGELVDSIQRRA